MKEFLKFLSLPVAIFVVAGILALVPLTASADVETFKTREGGDFKVHFFAADNPVATIIMFEGAGGLFAPHVDGFVSAQYDKFVSHGLNVAIMDPPADRSGFHGGMPLRFREKRAHAKDIRAVIRKMKRRHQLPVWLLGVSMGSKSVANIVSRRSRGIAGVVFVSSTMRPPPGFKAVTDHDLSGVKSAVLAVAHEDDGCRGTPPEGAREIVNAATSSRRAEVLMISGGSDDGRNPCGIRTPHTMYGVEEESVAGIAKFIKKNNR